MRLQPATAWPSPQRLPEEVKRWAVDLTRVLSSVVQQEAVYRQQIRIIFSTEAELLASTGALGQEAYAQDTQNWYKWNGTAWGALFVAGSGVAKHDLLTDIFGGGPPHYHLDAAPYLYASALNQHLHTGASPTFAGLTLSGLTAGQVVFPAAGGVLSGSANLFWDITRNRLGIGTVAPAFALDVVGNINATLSVRAGAATANGFRLPSYGALVEVGDIVYLMLDRNPAAYTYLAYSPAGLVYYRVAGTQVAQMSTTAFYPYADNAAALGVSTKGWASLFLSDAHAVAPAANGELVAFATQKAIVGRMGDTNVRFGGTVSNVASALGEFLSQDGLVRVICEWSISKDFWTTGKPMNVFAICRYRLPPWDLGAAYTTQVQIVLGTEVLVERTISHTSAAPGQDGYYYVELHSRVTKYAGNNLRNVARVKQSAIVLLGNWVEGAPLALVETALGRADPVVEDVTTANVLLQVWVTFSRSVPALRCVLMDAGWEAAG